MTGEEGKMQTCVLSQGEDCVGTVNGGKINSALEFIALISYCGNNAAELRSYFL